MSRELRRVPPNWEHPKDDRGRYIPLNTGYGRDIKEWISGRELWLKGKHKYQSAESYEEYAGDAPQYSSYMPTWTESLSTWFQVYETVSEGTPVTPPFATEDELIDYLATKGDFWDQARGDKPWGRENATIFVKQDHYAPTFIVAGGRFMTGIEALTEAHRE